MRLAAPAGTGPRPFEPDARYTLDPQVALRPEPFGALAYHYGSRRLTFLRSPLLVQVVKSLPHHPSVAAAVDDQVPAPRRAGFLRALAALADSRFIVASPLPQHPDPQHPDPEIPVSAHRVSENRPPENHA